VQEAVEAGAIRRERYQSYRKLLDELSGGGQRMPRHSSY
jgi:putative ribosome biogenesis GTPase RsgA